MWKPPWVVTEEKVQQPEQKPSAPDVLGLWKTNQLPPDLLEAAQVPPYDDWRKVYEPSPYIGEEPPPKLWEQILRPELVGGSAAQERAQWSKRAEEGVRTRHGGDFEPHTLVSRQGKPYVTMGTPGEAMEEQFRAVGKITSLPARMEVPWEEGLAEYQPARGMGYEEFRGKYPIQSMIAELPHPAMWIGGGGGRATQAIKWAEKARVAGKSTDDIVRGLEYFKLPKAELERIVEGLTSRAAEIAPKVEGAVIKTGMPVEVQNGIAKLRGALTEAGKLVEKTKGLRSKELSARVAKAEAVASKIENPAERAKAFWEQMGGKYAEGEYPAGAVAIRNALSEIEIRGMFKHIENAGFQPLTTRRAQSALDKVFGGERLQNNEVKLLEKIFGEGTFTEFSDPLTNKIFSYISDVINLPKAIEASTDISGFGRQGLALVTAYPKEGLPTFPNMLKYFFSDKSAKAANEAVWDTIKNSKWSDMLIDAYTRNKFYIAPWGEKTISGVSKRITNREETFFSRFASWLPITKWSERSFVVGLNKLRADVLIKNILPRLERSGVEITQTLVDDIAEMVTLSSGRGNLGPLNKYANWLNGLFFSARFQASRVQVPAHWARTLAKAFREKTPEATAVAVENTRMAFSWIAANLTMLAVAYYGLKAAGEKVSIEKDPRSSDLGQLRVGNTRVDPWVGSRPYLVLLSRVISGKTKQATTGKVVENDPIYLFGSFVRGKLAPIPSAVVDIKTGETIVGEEVKRNWKDIGKYIGEKHIPLDVNAVIDAIKIEGLWPGLPLGLLEVPGLGVTSYEPREKKTTKKSTKEAPELSGGVQRSTGGWKPPF